MISPQTIHMPSAKDILDQVNNTLKKVNSTTTLSTPMIASTNALEGGNLVGVGGTQPSSGGPKDLEFVKII